MSTLTAQTYEALCSALYGLPFSEFLGETESPTPGFDDRGRAAWFHLGDKPKDLRVSVTLPEEREEVVVKVEWRNYHADPRNPLKGEKTMRISTYAASQGMLEGPTQDAVVAVLEVYKQVLAEDGVAGKISDLVDDVEE